MVLRDVLVSLSNGRGMITINKAPKADQRRDWVPTLSVDMNCSWDLSDPTSAVLA
jgi:hypothetical protein